MNELAVIDPLAASWSETVQALPTNEEREELSRFIRHDLREGVGAGILRGLFLLLKANRLYLEQLPGKYRRELVQPLLENMLRIETGIARQIETQEKIGNQIDRCLVSAGTSADRMEAVVPKIERAVQNAFDNIDSSELTRKIGETVIEGAVKPVEQVNDKCDQLQEKLEKRAATLAPLMRWGTLLNLSLWASGVALALTVLGYIIVDDFHRDMTAQLQERVAQEIEKVHATAQVNEETLAALSKLNVTLEINPEKDWFGNVMPRHYCVVIKGADSGNTIYKDGQKYGAIFFQDQIGSIDLEAP